MATTADLLTRIAAGDHDAWGLLAERHMSTVRGVATAICGGCGCAEDAVQESFLRLRAGAGSFRVRSGDPEGDALRWLKRLVANTAIDQLRQHRRQRAQELADHPAPPSVIVDDGPSAAVGRALARLAPPSRAAVELRYRDGLEGGALAAALGISRVAARVRLYRALSLLRRHLATEGLVVAPALLASLLASTASTAEPVSAEAFAVPSPLPFTILIGGSMLTAAALSLAIIQPWAPSPAIGVVATQAEPPPAPKAAVAEALVATGIAWGSHPVWSSDGRLVVFAKPLEPEQQAGELRVIDLTTGGERSLGRVPYPDPIPAAEPATSPPRKIKDFSARPAMTMQPLAASAGAQVVWLSCRDQGLWAWHPAEGRLTMHHPAKPLSQPDRFQPAWVQGEGPDGRIAFVDRWSNQVALGDADGQTIAWLKVERIRGNYLDAVSWWQGHLADFQPTGATRLLGPQPATIPAPAFPAESNPGKAQLCGWDLERNEHITAEIPGGRRQPLLNPAATAIVLQLADGQGVERWRRQHDCTPMLARLRAASTAERTTPESIGRGSPVVHESVRVVAFRHPYVLVMLSLEVRYGFMGNVYSTFMRYDLSQDKLVPLGDGVYRWVSSGERTEGGTLPDCSASPDARAVAFHEGDRLVVLR